MATYDVVYLRNLLSELCIQSLPPARVYVDNTAVLQFCQGSSHQTRSRHFDLRFHYVKEKEQAGIIDTFHVSSQANLADLLTKIHPRATFERLRDQASQPQQSACLSSHKLFFPTSGGEGGGQHSITH
eukprot:766897-Hanusia_phi.AAC.1